ncbi:MAG: cytidylate kinase [Chthonomonadaceae bacterium]
MSSRTPCNVIAIDGPAGAGKSTVTKMLAKEMGLRYLDSGAMYRCVALVALRKGLSSENAGSLEALAQECEIEFADGDPQRVYLNGEEVTAAIREPQVGDMASAVSVHLGVRAVLVKLQQQIVAKGGCVLEGRDATTVIAPNACLKVFLTATAEERARRRYAELRDRGQEIPYEEVLRAIVERDQRDSERDASPLTLAPDAILIDSTDMTPVQVVEEIRRHALEAGSRSTTA